MKKSSHSAPVKKRKKYRRRKIKSALAKSKTLIIAKPVEVMSADAELEFKPPAKFRVPQDVRVRVLCLHSLRMPHKKIASLNGISPTTTLKIIHEAPEKNAFMLAMRDAGIMELLEIIPDAVKAVGEHVRTGMDPNVSLAILRGLQLLTPKAEVVEGAKEPPMSDEEVNRRLIELLGEGAKNKGKKE